MLNVPLDISIHALLAESDREKVCCRAQKTGYFYPRSPCGERRQNGVLIMIEFKFLSTLSLRRATVAQDVVQAVFAISIHALLAESDSALVTPSQVQSGFLSTLSLRRATDKVAAQHRAYRISIHALLAESDFQCSPLPAGTAYFYPRSPCGERHNVVLIGGKDYSISIHALLAESDGTTLPTDATTALFLSTLSLRRATCTAKADATRVNNFYPRSPCGERPVATTTATIRCYFYPRSPCGERRRCPQWRCLPIAISIHALLAESDLRPPCFRGRQKISIHALLAESDLPWHRPAWISSTFLSTLSLRRATR